MEQTTGQSLAGKRVAFLMTDGVEQIEYTSPRSFLEQHGATVILVSPKDKGAQVQGVHHDKPGDSFEVEMNVRDASPRDFDALVLPGGVANPDTLRMSAESIDFIRQFAGEEKPIAAICHGPWPLIDAGVAKASHMTSWPSLQTDLRNAGAEWTDDEVVIDGRLVTSRKPDDLPAFNNAIKNMLEIDVGAAEGGPSS
ncbi:type 1 glutamine amidotransferase [Massilia sp. PAMC28688]|uniref:type 1 glutamine amidotransferase domain-containing protein n=1 Tax=Massilia sp. PAMC28688 TaxID=2861283 RepID=UPI001C6351E6|nr:type 1 glutamine amidotransferase domain-containing protein [Massilia sp. PAMC28688]QYF94083.1 type 1 glutamine amidotransferase [Massilia sp. PAMC28688]